MSGEHILFHAGGVALATPATMVQKIHESLAVQPVNGTTSWFLGMAVADGQLLPVSDLGGYISDKPATGRTLEVSRHVGISGLRVDQVDGLSSVEPEALDMPAIDDLLADLPAISLSATDLTIVDLTQSTFANATASNAHSNETGANHDDADNATHITVYTISDNNACYQVIDLLQLMQSSRFLDIKAQ